MDAVIDNGSIMTDLNSLVDLPEVTLTYASAINNEDQIVAYGSNDHAYLLNPVPETFTTISLMAFSIAGLFLLRIRKCDALC